MTPETRYARTTDGTHVAYQVHGDGPVDILVQRGSFSNLDHEWEEPVLAGIYRRLASIGRVIRIDRRGSGLSDRIDPSALPTIEDRADDILAVMEAVQAERLVLLGLGHASAIFAVFAAAHPERTVALVMFSPPDSIVEHPGDVELTEYLAAIPARWATREHARKFVENGAPSRRDDEALVEWWRQEQQLSASPEDAVALMRLAEETNVDDILPTIGVPAMIVWRTESWAAETAGHIAGRIPGAERCELPGADAFLLAGDWQRAIACIERFILAASESAHEPDRVLATVLFTDIVGSTELAARVGDAAWRDVVGRHHTIVRRELARFRGREIDTAGDGFFAAFDGPGRAIRCAAAIRDGVRGLDLRLRMGIHAGECERVGTGLRGLAVHIGARVGGVAQPGEIVVSSTVRDLVAGAGIGFEDAGRHALKGVPDEWQLFRVASV
jgi:class 3 adenylate cyclase